MDHGVTAGVLFLGYPCILLSVPQSAGVSIPEASDDKIIDSHPGATLSEMAIQTNDGVLSKMKSDCLNHCDGGCSSVCPQHANDGSLHFSAPRPILRLEAWCAGWSWWRLLCYTSLCSGRSCMAGSGHWVLNVFGTGRGKCRDQPLNSNIGEAIMLR